MKKLKFFFSIIIFTLVMNSLTAQTSGSWILPYSINVNQLKFEPNTQTIIPLNQFVGEYTLNSAGGYDDNGDLLFFAVDYLLYYDEYNGWDNSDYVKGDNNELNSEIQIINKPGITGNYFFILYSKRNNGDTEGGGFYYTEIDATDPEQVQIGQQEKFRGVDVAGVMAFALTEEENGERYVYTSDHQEGLLRHTMNSNGITSGNYDIVVNQNYFGIGNEFYFDAYNMELIKDNNDETIIAWITTHEGDKDKLFMVNADTQEGALFEPQLGRISGIEFTIQEENIIYLSCSNGGIYKYEYDIATGSGAATLLPNSSDYKRTFLQTAPDGRIYAVSDDRDDLGRIDLADNGNFYNNYISIYVNSVYDDNDYYSILPENGNYIKFFTLEVDSNQVACPGDCNGYAWATPSTGNEGDYTWVWTDENQNIVSTAFDADNLCEGQYVVCATDTISNYTVCDTIEITLDPNTFDYNTMQYYPSTLPTSPWNNVTLSFKDGFTIASGETLELTNNTKLMFGEDARLIIEPGAKLIVDNSTLTNHNLCPAVWSGVEVWGDPSTHQFEFSGPCAQGKLIMENNSVIEHAMVGARTHLKNSSAKAGGIIQAEESSFLNCARGVEFWQYANIYNSKEYDNVSKFNECVFDINNNSIVPFFDAFAYLYGVKGISFVKCDFTNNKDALPAAKGINSLNAGFSIDGKCDVQIKPCPAGHYQQSYFHNLECGVWASNTGTTNKAITVENTFFDSNITGVYLSNVDDAVILFCDFNIAKNTGDAGICEGEGTKASGYGIDLDHCTGFAIEENYFTKSGTGGVFTGIRCKDSHTNYDIIYRNTFNDLSYGNFAEGMNRSDPNLDLDGLEYQCNTNMMNSVDFIVTGGQYPQIRTFQGTQEMEAGNTFSTGVQLPDGHFRNNGTQTIDYFYHNNPPIYYTPYYVVPIHVSGENTCPSHYGGGGGGGNSGKSLVLTPEQKQQTEQDFAANLSNFNNVKALYDNLKDGGNTGLLLNEVELSWPDDMWELRAELLGKSPHLSKEVLIKAADKTDVLPESILFEILSANPDELRKDELIKYLENKEQPLPEYMISILKQLAGGITYKTILLQEMAKYQAGKTVAAYDLIRSTLNDTVTDYQYLRNWLDNLNNMDADMQIVSSYIAEANYTSAQTLLDMMPGLYELEGNELNSYNEYKSLTEMQITWKQQGRTIFDLDSTEISTLVDYAENSSGKASVIAKGILEFAYGYNYCNCLPVNDTLAMKSSVAFTEKSGSDSYSFVEATPNPAKTWVAFDYKLPVFATEAVLRITDVTGKTITNFSLNAKQGQQVWDIRNIEKGVYLYTLKTGSLSKSGKLIIK